MTLSAKLLPSVALNSSHHLCEFQLCGLIDPSGLLTAYVVLMQRIPLEPIISIRLYQPDDISQDSEDIRYIFSLPK